MKNLKDATDNELVEMSKENPDAFSELVVRYQSRLFGYIKRISYFEIEDVEDILQETFIKIYRGLNLFDGDLKFSTWAYQIARNSTIDAIRRKHSRPQSLRLEDSELIRIFKSGINISKEAVARDSLEKVKLIINRLPFKYQEVLILKFLEEKSYEEIMDIVKKPKGTVAALINRGRKMIVDEAGRQGLMDISGGERLISVRMMV